MGNQERYFRTKGKAKSLSVRQGRSPAEPLNESKAEEGRQWLEQGARAMGISLSPRHLSLFMDYLFLLQKWNRFINLTGLYSWQEIIIKHFLDSLTLLPYLPQSFRLLDLGSGAGFPGLPVKIMHPNQEITLVEASAKKVSFLREVVRRLDLRPIDLIQIFLDQKSPAGPGLEKPFDIVTTRALGRLPDILTTARTFLVKGGKLILMKGRKGVQELNAAAALIQDMDFQMEEPIFLTLPLTNQERTLIILTKIGRAE